METVVWKQAIDRRGLRMNLLLHDYQQMYILVAKANIMKARDVGKVIVL
jgi:hypothetical protein